MPGPPSTLEATLHSRKRHEAKELETALQPAMPETPQRAVATAAGLLNFKRTLATRKRHPSGTFPVSCQPVRADVRNSQLSCRAAIPPVSLRPLQTSVVQSRMAAYVIQQENVTERLPIVMT
jgi:hypothetical protein